MRIVAQMNGGFMLEASDNEIRELKRSLGYEDKQTEGKIGDNFPATNIATQIKTMRGLADSYDMREMWSKYKALGDSMQEFKDFTTKFKTE